jgi:hypothetical protein
MTRSPFLCARCGVGIRLASRNWERSRTATSAIHRARGKDILRGRATLRGGLAHDDPMNRAVRERLNAKRLGCGADDLLSRNVAHVLC